jgi:hypothetical protein
MTALSPQIRFRNGKGQHRRAHTHPVIDWLRVGSVAVGLGAAVATGHGVAAADTGTDGSSAASHADSSTHDSAAGAGAKSASSDAAGSSATGAAGSASSGLTASVQAQPTTHGTDGGSRPVGDHDKPKTSAGPTAPAPSTSSSTPSTGATDLNIAPAGATNSTAPSEGESVPAKSIKPRPQADTSRQAEAATPSRATADMDAHPTVASAAASAVATPLAKKALVAVTPKAVVATATASSAISAATPAAVTVIPAYPAAVTAPVTLSGIVSDLLKWVGLPGLAQNSPIPAIPIPEPLAALWIGVREIEYRVNNQYPTARPTTNTEQPYTGVITGNLNATDPDGDHLTYTVAAAPTNGSVVVNDDGSFTYTPDAAEAHAGGADAFSVTVSDDNDYNLAHVHGLLGLLGFTTEPTVTVPITVTPVSTPVITVSAVAGAPDPHTGVTTITITGTDTAGNALTYTATSDQGALSPSPTSTTTLTFTPGTGYTPTDVATTPSHAVDTIAITATDSTGAIGTANVTITQKPDTSIPSGGPVISEVDTVLSDNTGRETVTITATDSSGKVLSYSVNTGTLAANGDGTYTYTPDFQALAGPNGDDGAAPVTYKLTATDGDAVTSTTVVVATDLPITADELADNPALNASSVVVSTVAAPISASDSSGALTPAEQQTDISGHIITTYQLSNQQTLQQDPLTVITTTTGVIDKTTIIQPGGAR